MANLPPTIYAQNVGVAGSGLFTSTAVSPGEEIFRIARPMVSVLDSPRLIDTCSNCNLWLREAHDDAVESGRGGEEKGGVRRLRACQGCRIVRYCSKDCQAQSWKNRHRYECKIFAKLYPNVLPNTVRIIMQLLLRRKAKSVPDSDWQGLLDLQSHLDGFHSSQTKNEEGLTTWQTIELMSQAASSYSGTRESMHIVQSITARVLVNTHTLTTPTFDPLGLCLSPQSALLNHSCIPNAIIIFSGPMLILRSVAPIAVNTELLISYIDTTNSSSTRRAELQDRYFFTCTCEACSSNTANGFPDSGQDKVFQKIEARAIAMQAEAAKLPAENAAHVLKSALDVLQPYPPHRQPYPSILHTVFLNAITSQSWPTALNYTLKAYFFIDPVHHPLNWHPVRIVRKWVLLRLVVQIAGLVSENDDSVKAMENFGIDWQIVAVGLYREIADGVIFSHGRESPFADQVKALGEGTGIVGASVGRKRVTEEWGTLRKVADQTTP